jgi:hypothetical protein
MSNITDDDSKKLNISFEVFKKTLAYDISSVKYEDIGKRIGEFIAKVLKKKVTIENNALTSDIKATIKD